MLGMTRHWGRLLQNNVFWTCQACGPYELTAVVVAKTYALSSQPEFQCVWWRGLQSPLLADGLLGVDGYWRREGFDRDEAGVGCP